MEMKGFKLEFPSQRLLKDVEIQAASSSNPQWGICGSFRTGKKLIWHVIGDDTLAEKPGSKPVTQVASWVLT